MSFFPGGPTYERVWGLPSQGHALADEGVVQALADLRVKRAQRAGQREGTGDWATRFERGLAGWAITPTRAYLTGTLQAHEAISIIIGQPVLAPAPSAIVIDLGAFPGLVAVREPEGGGGWDPAEF
jgi:hypothetical protein